MERDDIIEYSLDAHHSDEAGKLIRKKIWKVTAILTLITIAEVLVGVFFTRFELGGDSWAWFGIKMFYIILTIIKAAYIVLVFMHLGDERKGFKWVILGPYVLFALYLLWICVTESNYLNSTLIQWYLPGF